MEVVMAYLRHLSTMTSEGSRKPRQTGMEKSRVRKNDYDILSSIWPPHMQGWLLCKN